MRYNFLILIFNKILIRSLKFNSYKQSHIQRQNNQ